MLCIAKYLSVLSDFQMPNALLGQFCVEIIHDDVGSLVVPHCQWLLMELSHSRKAAMASPSSP